jgi:hypothetical protein
LEAPAKTETKPSAAKRENERGRKAPKALPRVEPIKTKGTNSPPLNPDPIVREVNRVFSTGEEKEDILKNDS